MIAQAVARQQRRDRRKRAVDAEARMRRCGLRMRVRRLEHAARDVEPAAGRDIERTAAEIDACVAAGHAHAEIGVVDRWQARYRLHRRAAGLDVERKTVLRQRRTRWAELG